MTDFHLHEQFGHACYSVVSLKFGLVHVTFCFGLQVRELNVEAAKLTSSHPNAAQDIEWKRHELEEAWANLREQVFNLHTVPQDYVHLINCLQHCQSINLNLSCDSYLFMMQGKYTVLVVRYFSCSISLSGCCKKGQIERLV